ncbi:hypothetical protein V7O66_06410 [Methanolobus sp. ZRKC3]|uniref:hypothetical protein n=1 Tax=Methanolobus sp. ZRKC3 TaxID=3125786 RepID=UPI00324864F1
MDQARMQDSKQRIIDLIKECDELWDILERNSVWNADDYQKNRSMFIAGYTKWYRSTLPIIRDLLPERVDKFQSLFRTTKRSWINDYTYTIQDYIHGIYLENRMKVYTDGITSNRLKEQKEILKDAVSRIDGFTFDIQKFVKINPTITGQTSFSTPESGKLLNVELADEHYRHLKNEINLTFKNGLFISTFILSRKLIENLMLDILKTRFPPISNENANLYFDRKYQIHKDFNLLLDSFEQRKGDFPIDTEELDQFIQELSIFKLKEKANSHSINDIPDSNKIRSCNIEKIVEGFLEISQMLKEESPI